jgi:membrane protease YdiL (CAAX protease family)
VTLAQRVTPWGFPFLYLGWAYLLWIPVLGSDTSVWSGWNLILFLLGGASPLLASVVLAALTGGRARVADLGRRLVDVRRIGLRWWLVLLTFWLAFDLVMALAAVLLRVTAEPLQPDWSMLADPGPLAFLVVLSFVLPAVEEVGLRGYYLDRLQERFDITTAALINGATWAIWHAPFVAFPSYYANTTFDPDLSWWLPMIVLDTVLIVWVYDRTGRSILAALVFHGMMNLTGEILGITAEMYPFVLTGHAVAAALVIVGWRRRGAGPDPARAARSRGTQGVSRRRPAPGSG